MTSTAADVTLLWLRRDLRLHDHPGWAAALEGGGPVVPVFILDPLTERSYGAAPRWRLGESLAALAGDLGDLGSRLILRRGPALDVLRAMIAETGARRVIWSRQYEPDTIARDTEIKTELAAQGIACTSVNASLLFEPWTVETKTGGYYRVFTPFWKAVRDIAVGPVLPRPADLAPPEAWPESERLSDWAMGAAMQRGAAVVAPHAEIGETRAHARLARFVEKAIGGYRHERDFPALPATSRLSENLTYGEISPRTVWQAGWLALREDGAEGAETFLKEIVWREFAYHLLYHTPHIRTGNWRPEWDGFAWRGDNPEAERWRRGMTGVEIVDAAMREMYVTGTMHNRARMLVASYLTKHLLTHWKIGSDWFADCLIDWDPASNAMGWQWAAGSGPDASPYFRIFNPETQAEKFDAQRQYRDRFLAEGRSRPHPDALAFFDAIPRTWKLSPRQGYPTPMIGLAEGRQRALDAYSNRPAA